MTYIDKIAAAIRQALPEDARPDESAGDLYRLYALLALVKGATVSRADVHDAWSVWMLGQDPDHVSIKPFDELAPEVQQEDSVYVDAIRKAATSLVGRK